MKRKPSDLGVIHLQEPSRSDALSPIRRVDPSFKLGQSLPPVRRVPKLAWIAGLQESPASARVSHGRSAPAASEEGHRKNETIPPSGFRRDGA